MKFGKEFEACGVPHRERGTRVSEAIDAVRTLWRDTPASFKPERYAQSVEKIRRAAAEAGPSPDGFVTAHLTFVTVGRDYESAERTWVQKAVPA